MKDCKKQCVESFLPLDLVGDILSRLPVKSLIRFRCVCKPWRFLINDANFAKEQHIRAFPALICPYDKPDGRRINLYDFDGPECDIKERMPPLEFKELAACHTLSNSVNGLICGYSCPSRIYNQKYCLLNPSTRALVRVPGPDLNQEVFMVNLGLGFDVLTGNYKLVLLCRTDVLPLVCSCFVLTVGCDDKWRYVGDTTPALFPLWQPVFVEGVINWISHFCYNGGKVILAFHVKDEKFHVISTPKSELLTHGMYLSNCDEHLWLSGKCEECLSIWKLHDYTSQKWTRECQIDISSEISTVYGFHRLVAIKDDKFVLLHQKREDKFVLNYTDIDTRSAEVMVFDNARKSLKYHIIKSLPAASYTESLICPRNLLGVKEVV